MNCWKLLLCAVLFTVGNSINTISTNHGDVHGFDSINYLKSSPWEEPSPIATEKVIFSSPFSQEDGELFAESLKNQVSSQESYPGNFPTSPDIRYDDSTVIENSYPLLPPDYLFYQTTNGDIFGPFPYQQIMDWFYAGHFSDSLLVSQDPQIYSFSPLRDFLLVFDPCCPQDQKHLYDKHYLSQNGDHPRQSSFLDKMKKSSSQLSNWITSKAQQSTSSTTVQNTAAHVSSLLHESSDLMRKAMEWSNMKRRASSLIPKKLKTLLPLNTRSRYQDAHLDALWSKRNRQQTRKQPTIDPRSEIENSPNNDESTQGTVDIGEGQLFQFSDENRSSLNEEEAEENTVSENKDFEKTENSAFSESNQINNNLKDGAYDFDRTIVSSATFSPSKSRTLFQTITSCLPSWPNIRTKAIRKGIRGEDNVLQLWDMTDKHPILSSSLSSTYHTHTTYSTLTIAKKLGISVIYLVQLLSWVVLFQGVITDVDWVIWASRYEDILHRLLVVDFLDPAVYQYVLGAVLDNVRKVTQSPGDNISLMIETVRSWFVHSDNIAMFGVMLTTVILSLANGYLLPRISFLSVFGFLILCLNTKLLSSLEFTSGVAAWTVGGGMSIDPTASPSQVLIMRVASVMQRMKILWFSTFLTIGVHYLMKSSRQDEYSFPVDVDTVSWHQQSRQPERRSYQV